MSNVFFTIGVCVLIVGVLVAAGWREGQGR